MDYSKLALELIKKMYLLHRATPQKSIDEAMQGEAYVLHFIAERGSNVMPGEIGGAMNVSSARVAQTLNNIESKGLIVRQTDVNDRRRVLVSLTPEGRSAAEKHQQNLLSLVTEMLKLLGERDAREYVRITGKLADAISKNDNEESL